MKKTVVLIGFPGSGKTSVGKALNKVYGWSLVDADTEVERREGKTIAEIIRLEGEPYFRQLEREAILAALAQETQVLSVGGGALLNEVTRAEIAKRCWVVYLKVGPEVAAARVEADEVESEARGRGVKRPLLAPTKQDEGKRTDTLLERIKKLMAERKPLYVASADREIETEGRLPEEIAGEIVREWEQQR